MPKAALATACCWCGRSDPQERGTVAEDRVDPARSCRSCRARGAPARAPRGWGGSASGLQCEDRAEKPGDKNYYGRDWDLLVDQEKAPVVGNALYTWSDFDKDLSALKKIGVTHYRFSIEWARVEPHPGQYNEAAVQGYVRM